MIRFAAITALCLCHGAGALAHQQALPGVVLPQITPAQFVFDNAVRRTNDLPTEALRDLRRRMIAGATLRFADLRALADAGDGLAAFRLAQRMAETGTPDTTGSKAHYYAIAAYTGRSFAVRPLANLLVQEGANYSAARLRHALNAMTVQALSGNGTAATLLGQMYATGVPFGRDLAQAQRFLAMADADAGADPRAALQLGLALIDDPADRAAGHVAARAALTLAAAGDDLSVRVTAENLLRIIDTPIVPKVTE